MNFFGELEELAGQLYPYRWPITIGLIVLLVSAAVFAYRRGWHLTVWRHRMAAAIIAVPLLAAAIPIGWYTLSPLWERSFLEETSPLAMASDGVTQSVTPQTGPMPAVMTPTPAPATAEAFTPRVTHSGEFTGGDDFHFGRGRALLIETEPGRYTLRFEAFSVRNGPDLFVYLSPSADGYAEGALNLGGLKATDGSFNYEVPEGTDISQFKSVIIWCRRFTVLFAVAPLVEA